MKPASNFSDPAAQPPNRHSFFNLPGTRLGSWSVRLAIAFFAFLGVFYGLIAAGQRGGATFFSNPWLAISILLAAFSAIGAGVTAVVAILWKKERSFLDFLAMILGAFVLLYIILEFAFPH